MIKYVIHACPSRMWYVNDYLVPSMKSQGITLVDVKCDTNNRGCLEHCMDIFMKMWGDGGTWHLQDDVIICRNFKELTEEYSSGIVCGFDYVLDHPENVGYVTPDKMWYSFPCIHIPNELARECAKWFYKKARKDDKYAKWVAERKFDDSIFQEFLINNYPEMRVLNLKPNLVDHVDFLIGGSIINGARKYPQTRAQYFDDNGLVTELKNRLEKR